MSRSRTETRKRSGVQFASSSDEDDQGNLQRVFSHNPSNPISSRTPSVASDDPKSPLSQSPQSPFASLRRSNRHKRRAQMPQMPSFLSTASDVSVPSSPSYVGSARSSLDSHRPEVGALLSANHLSESPTRLGPERIRETPPVSAHDQASTVNWPPHWAQGLNPFTTPRITIDHKPFGEKAPAGLTAGFGSEAWSPTHRWGEGRILNEKQTKEKEMLEAEVTKDLIDLALGVVAYNYRKSHAASMTFKEDAVFLDEIAETFRGDKLLDEAADSRLYRMIDPTGRADVVFDQEGLISRKDALWHELIYCTRRTLLARSRINQNANEARKDLTSAIDQHVHTAEYLVGDHLYFGAGLAHSDIALLGTMRGTYATSGSHGTQQELEMLREVTHGRGKRLRDRMWAIMGWSITAGFNSRLRDVDWAGTPDDPQDDGLQTSIDHASCLIQRFLPSRNERVASEEEYGFGMSRIGDCLHLLRQNWNNGAWYDEGRRIATVPLDDAFRDKRYSSLDNLADVLDPQLDRMKLRHATALQNYRVLEETLPGDASSAAVKRSALQLCLNTRYVQNGPRGDVISGPGSNPGTFSEGMRRLLGTASGTEDARGVLTGSNDVAEIRKYLDDYIRLDTTTRWKPRWWADNTAKELEPCTSGSMILVKPEP